jgi:hypothetical protein
VGCIATTHQEPILRRSSTSTKFANIGTDYPPTYIDLLATIRGGDDTEI